MIRRNSYEYVRAFWAAFYHSLKKPGILLDMLQDIGKQDKPDSSPPISQQSTSVAAAKVDTGKPLLRKINGVL
jgi:hypothetical protein